MKKGYGYLVFLLTFIYIFIFISIIPSIDFVSEDNVRIENYVSDYTVTDNVSKKGDLIAYVGNIPIVEVKEPVVEVAYVPVSQPVSQPVVYKQPVKAEPQPVHNIEDDFNLGTITISNSDFSRRVIMDDGTYYYLNHDLYGNYNNVGMPIIDVRTNFKTRKTLIYAHSAQNGRSPFNYLQNYHNNQGFYNNHRYITISYEGHTYKYEIFSVYVSVADSEADEGLEYYRRTYYSDEEWGERINWYKNNSEYDTGVSVSSSDKILIFQTCSMDPVYYHKYYRANLVVMAKLIEG